MHRPRVLTLLAALLFVSGLAFPMASFAQEILSAGGVVAYLREHGDFPRV